MSAIRSNYPYIHRDTSIATDIDVDIDVDIKMEATAREAHTDGSHVLDEAWTEQWPYLRQHLTQTLPAHMHPLLSIIADYARPSPRTCWQPVFAAAADAPATASRASGYPFRGWDVTTGAVLPPLLCARPACRTALVVVYQLNLSELPTQLGAALGAPTRMLQVLTCPIDQRRTLARIVQWTGHTNTHAQAAKHKQQRQQVLG